MYEKPDDKMHAPQMLTPEGLRTLNELITVTANSGMLSAEDAKRARMILQTNPELRLSRFAGRLKNIEDLVFSMQSVDSRMETLLEKTKEELTTLAEIAGKESPIAEHQ